MSCKHGFYFVWSMYIEGAMRKQRSCVACGEFVPYEEENKTEAKSEAKADSLPPASVPAWMQFRHNVPGECPCGVPRGVCEYHREVRA